MIRARMQPRQRVRHDPIFDRSGAIPPPRWRDLAADLGVLAFHWSRFGGRLIVPHDLPRGDGHPVLVIPGLLSSDWLIRGFRQALEILGYQVEGWGAGINFGPTESAWDCAALRLREMAAESGQRVSLVGHSLGGVLARALAAEHPELVRQVVTVCSPFRLPTASRWRLLYSALSYWHIEDATLISRLAEPPPVPTTAIYSPQDGAVAWQSCIDEPAPGRENIAVTAGTLRCSPIRRCCASPPSASPGRPAPAIYSHTLSKPARWDSRNATGLTMLTIALAGRCLRFMQRNCDEPVEIDPSRRCMHGRNQPGRASAVPVARPAIPSGAGHATGLELRSLHQRVWAVSAAAAQRLHELPPADAADLRPAGFPDAGAGRLVETKQRDEPRGDTSYERTGHVGDLHRLRLTLVLSQHRAC